VKDANLLLQGQARVRAAKRELAEKKQAKKEDDAAVVMGSLIRMRNDRARFKKERSAIIALQCSARCMKARSTLFSEKTKARLARQALEKKSATIMQGGWKIRRAIDEKWRRRDARDFRMAAFMQAGVRRWRKRVEFKKYRSGVIVLQNGLRVKQSKAELGRRLAERDRKMATLLQTRQRANVAKREFERDKSCILKVQTLHRMRAEKKEYGKAQDATLLMQKRIRVKNATNTYKKARKDVTSAQSLVRMALAKKEYRKNIKLTKALQRAVKILLRNIRLQDALLRIHGVAKKGKVDELVMMLDEYREFDLRHIRNRYGRRNILIFLLGSAEPHC
jgi:hypothetical protein